MTIKKKLFVPALAVAALAACQQTNAVPAKAVSHTVYSQGSARVASAEAVVYKSRFCGCCGKWVTHLEGHDYKVTTHDVDDVAAVKERLGVPDKLASCHTAEIGGYAVEGHVPADVIARLLAEKPDIKGIAVPGMPAGSPGMESANPEPYNVVAFKNDGSTYVFATVNP